MNTGTQAAKEAGNMVDTIWSDQAARGGRDRPRLRRRGSLTTFSITNDGAKYFAIIPAASSSADHLLAALDVMRLATPSSAILSA